MIKIIRNIEESLAVEFALNRLMFQCNQKKVSFELILTYELGKEPQSYSWACKGKQITISASDQSGLMYGILDLETKIKHNESIDDIQNVEVVPLIKERGIKINIPLDSRTPSYSDASDSAFFNVENMWDFDYWKEFLDLMAINKYNVLSLWTLSPFPSLVHIPQYPEIALEDVKVSTRPIKADLPGRFMYTEDMQEGLVTLKKMSMDEKINFWQSVMEYAEDRCIKLLIMTWNIFVYGTEGNPYGITDDQNNPVTKDYIYHGVKALMETYPLLGGIGVTAGENMQRDETDISFIADSYGKAVRDHLRIYPNRDFKFIHRMHYAHYDSIMEEFQDFPCTFGMSFKYSQAHMYSSTKPLFIEEFLKDKDPNLKIWLTLRNDDFYMQRWGNPDFAREYLNNLPVSEMIGYYMGADGYTWGRDYMDLRNTQNPLFIDKMWYMFSIWGNLSYNIKISNQYFMKEIQNRFDIEETGLFTAWQCASDIIPIVNQVHWHDYDFQWYPEGCCMYDFETDKLLFADINEFMTCQSMPGSNYYSISEYSKVVENGGEIVKIDPLSAAKCIWNHGERAISIIKEIRKCNQLSTECIHTLDDIENLSNLGFYYAAKIKAAVCLSRYKLNHQRSYQKLGIEQLKEASKYWEIYSSRSKKMYKPQVFTRLSSYVDLERFDQLAALDVLLAQED